MSPAEMMVAAAEAINGGTRMTMVFKKGHKRPHKFPRGELLCENADGRNVYSFDPVRVMAWLVAMGLVERKP